MAIGDNIRARRIARGWTEQDFADRKASRQKAWNGVKAIAGIVPVPLVGAAVNVADKAVAAGKEIKAGRTSIGKVLAATPEILNAAIDTAKADVGKPSFDQEMVDLLKSPISKMALELAGKLIHELEDKMKIDIPEAMEQAIFEAVHEAMDDLYEGAEDQLKSFAKKAFSKVVDVVKGFLAKTPIV